MPNFKRPDWLNWGTKKDPESGKIRPGLGSGGAEQAAEKITDAKLRRKKAICEDVEGGYWDPERNVCLPAPTPPPVD